MEQNVYIPGDLVMTNGVPLGTKEGVVYRITACDPSKTLKLNDGTVLKGTVCLENIEGASIGDKGFLMGDCFAWVKDIVPLKLSFEILEKNEWEKEEDGFYHSPYFHSLHIERLNKLDFGVYHLNYFLCGMRNVHQLQHLLFGLGLDNRLEV